MRKRILSALLACSLLLPCMGVGATAQQITLNGQTLDIPADMGRIQEKDDRTFVPLRFVMEHLGCVVNYNDIQKSATITDQNNVSYLLLDGSESLFVLPNIGVPRLYTMDTKTFIDEEDERMYLPIRFLATALGYDVDWDPVTETVSLSIAAK